jgi:hypothetical protein
MNFINNKYCKWYLSIVNNAKSRILPDTIYIEKHHIIPKSLNGSDDKENLVNLTAREHFICHLLLTKIVEGKERNKMVHALWRMTVNGHPKQDRYKTTSRIYEIARKMYVNEVKGRVMSDATKQKLRNANLGKKLSDEAREKMSKSRKGKTYDKIYSEGKIEELKLRKSLSMKGKNAGKQSRLGKLHTDDTYKKMSETQKLNRIKMRVVCEHCGKDVDKPNYSRSHGSKCKVILLPSCTEEESHYFLQVA